MSVPKMYMLYKVSEQLPTSQLPTEHLPMDNC